MMKTSMSDYEKLSVVTYPFYLINRQSIHKTNCMQRIKKKILMREVFPAIALNEPSKLIEKKKKKKNNFKLNGVVFEFILTYSLPIECHFNHYLTKQN